MVTKLILGWFAGGIFGQKTHLNDPYNIVLLYYMQKQCHTHAKLTDCNASALKRGGACFFASIHPITCTVSAREEINFDFKQF